MSEREISTDEMLGFILRNLSEFEGVNLTYEEIKAVLDMEEAFLNTKGIIEEIKPEVSI